MPRFIIFVRGSPQSEAESKPSPEILQLMSAYNASLANAGILLSADGLHPSSRDSKRIVFHNSGTPTIQDGPFPANELVAGFWIVKCKDINEAMSWALKAPFKEGGVTEVRRIAELEDFDGVSSPEVQQKDEETKAKAAENAKSV